MVLSSPYRESLWESVRGSDSVQVLVGNRELIVETGHTHDISHQVWKMNAMHFGCLTGSPAIVLLKIWHHPGIVAQIKLLLNRVKHQHSLDLSSVRSENNRWLFPHSLWFAKNYRFDWIALHSMVCHVLPFLAAFRANPSPNFLHFCNLSSLKITLPPDYEWKRINFFHIKKLSQLKTSRKKYAIYWLTYLWIQH